MIGRDAEEKPSCVRSIHRSRRAKHRNVIRESGVRINLSLAFSGSSVVAIVVSDTESCVVLEVPAEAAVVPVVVLHPMGFCVVVDDVGGDGSVEILDSAMSMATNSV